MTERADEKSHTRGHHSVRSLCSTIHGETPSRFCYARRKDSFGFAVYGVAFELSRKTVRYVRCSETVDHRDATLTLGKSA